MSMNNHKGSTSRTAPHSRKSDTSHRILSDRRIRDDKLKDSDSNKEEQKPNTPRISRRFDLRKTSNPFSETNKHKTTFSKAYDAGRIPCRVLHSTASMHLKWDIPIHEIEFDPLLIECADGLRETSHPYAFVARQAFKELLLQDEDAIRAIPLLPKIVPLIRLALQSNQNDVAGAALDALQQLSNATRDHLNSHIPGILTQMNRRMMDKRFSQKVLTVLNTFEANSVEPIEKMIKSKCPTYTSIK